MNKTDIQFNNSSFAHRFFSPIKTIKSQEPIIKKVVIVALSIFVGIFTAFIPHLIYFWLHRNVVILNPNRKPYQIPNFISNDNQEPIDPTKIFKMPRQVTVEKTDKLIEVDLPMASTAFKNDPQYGKGANILAHLTGHRVAGNTTLEGASHKDILTHTIDFLENRSSQILACKPAIIKKLKIAKKLAEINNLTDFTKTIRNEMTSFQTTHDSVLIPFGWKGDPGHAMYIEVRYENETHCTVRLFNLGSGGQSHINSDHKMIPFLDWEGVEIAKFTSTATLQALFELCPTSQKEERNYSQKDIYISFKRLLDPKAEKKQFSENEFPFAKWMSPQEIGICCWKSLSGFLSNYLTKTEYKTFITEIKIDAVYKFASDNYLSKTKNSEYLLEQVIKATSSYVDKQIRKNTIPSKYRKIALEQFEKVRKLWNLEGVIGFGKRLVDKIGDKGANDKPLEEGVKYKPYIFGGDKIDFLYKDSGLSFGKSGLNPISPNSIEVLQNIQKLAKTGLTYGDSRFNELKLLLEKDPNLWKSEGLAIHQGLLEFMKILPFMEEEWIGKFSPEQAKEILAQTLKISEIAFASWYGIPTSWVTQPDQIYIFKKLSHVQKILHKVAFSDSGELFQVLPASQSSALGSWEKTVDNQTAAEFSEPTSYDMIKQNSICLNIMPKILDQLPLSLFWRTLKQYYPTYVESLEAKFPKIGQQKLVAEALIAHDLPDAIKASRNTQLFLLSALNSLNLPDGLNIDKLSGPSAFEPNLSYEVYGTPATTVVFKPSIIGCSNPGESLLYKLGGSIEKPAYATLEKKYLNLNDKQEAIVLPKNFPEEELKNWSSQEICHLLRIFASKNMHYNDLLAYCKKENSKAIYDADFQRLFIRLLLKGKPNEQLVHLQNWLKEQLTGIIRGRSGELTTACFLLRALRYSYWMSPNSPIPDEHFEQIETLKRKAEGTSASRLIYLEEVVTSSKKNTWTDQELLTFAKDLCVLNHYPLNSNDIDPLWLFEIGKANLKLAHEITQYVENDPNRINQILQIIDSDSKNLGWKKEGEGTFTSQEGDIFYSHSCRFKLKKFDSKETFISPKILEKRNFQSLFPNTTKAKYIEIENKCYYEFTDPSSKRLTQITFEGEISQLIDNEWWTWTPIEDLSFFNKTTETVQFLLGSGSLTCRCRTFRNKLKKGNFICENPITHELLYKATHKECTLVVEDLKTNLILSSPSCIFTSMTHPDAIEEWYNKDGELEQCSLPTLGLQFVKDGTKFYCEQIPGFYLDLSKGKQSVIPNCPFGLVLENESGERRFLLPELDKISGLKKQNSLIPHYHVSFSLETLPIGKEKYHMYEYSKEGALKTRNPSAELYLASFYVLFKDYKQAFELLKKHKGQLLSFVEHPALGISIRKIIELNEIIGDTTPHALALNVFNYFLLLKNSLNYPKKSEPDFSPKDHKKLSQYYEKYIKKQHHVHFVSLLKDEELFLIEHIDPKMENAFIQDRKNFLNGVERKPISSPLVAAPMVEVSCEGDLPSNLYNVTFQNPPNANVCETNLVTRPALSKNLNSYYQIALTGSLEQKKWLNAALIFAKLDGTEKNANAFLKYVLKFPEGFISTTSCVDYSSWVSKTREILTNIKLQEKSDSTSPTILQETYSQDPHPFFSSIKPLEPIEGTISFAFPQNNIGLADVIKNTVETQLQPKVIPQTLIDFLKTGQSASSPLEQAEYKRLEEDLEEYKKEMDAIHSIKEKDKFLEAIKDKGEAKHLENLKEKILTLANTLPKDNEQLQMLKLQGHIQLFNLDELLINFARQKPELLQKNNPSLSKSALTEIYKLCGEYLVIATDQQQKARVKKALDKNLDQEATTLALAKRAYTLDSSDPKSQAYLVFEFYSDLLLRPEQVNLQTKFLDNLDKCYAQEMIMGSGKSKVISILLALLRADGKNISTNVVSKEFFKDVAPHTSEILLKTFQQTLETIHFDRGTPLTASSLKSIIQTLESVKQNQNSLIVTSKTLQCLVLRFLEEWIRFSETDKKELPRELEILKEIISKIKNEGNLLIDELDTVLNILHTVSFSLGKKERPKSSHLKIDRCIYEILYMDDEIKLLGQLESDPNPNPNAKPLTKENYKKNIKTPLAKKFLLKLPSIKFEKNEDQEASIEIEHSNREALVDFICQDPQMDQTRIKAATDTYNLLSPHAKELVSEAALQIGHLLENTLTKTSNEKYGVPQGDLFAIPYSAANTPCKGSEFASHKVTCNNTRQSFAKYPMETGTVRNLIEKIMKKIHNDKEKKEGGLEDLLNSWENKLGISFSQKKRNWQAISDKINSSLLLKFDFLDDFYFKEMEFFQEKITSNSQNIAESALRMFGFTGTLWNMKTFHSKFIASPEKGTDSKTLALLFSYSNKPTIEFEKVTNEWDMFIDAGGYYKEHENVEVAREIARARKRPVVFYHNRVQTVTNGIKERPFKDINLKVGDFDTFLDQTNTTGADVEKKHKAKGYVTIKAGMLKRDLLQAVWRLRGLATKGQTIEWIIDKNTASLIRSSLNLKETDTIGFAEILTYTIRNESEQVGKDDYEAFTQQIENIKQQILLQSLLSDATVDEKRKILSELKSAWCKPETSSTPSKHFCTIPVMIDTAVYLEDQQKQVIDQINGLSISDIFKKKAIDAIIEIVKRYKAPGMLLEKIQSPQATADDSVDVEQESQQEMEVDVEVVQDQEKAIVALEHGSAYNFWDITPTQINEDGKIPILGACNTLSLESYFSKHPNFKNLGIENAFEGVAVSLNFLEKNIQMEHTIQNYHLHETYQKEFDYVVFERGLSTLISQREADAYYYKYVNGSRVVSYDIFSLKSGEFLKRTSPLLTNEQSEHVLKIRFLAGSSDYNEEEIMQLERWLKQYPKLIDFYKNVIIKNNRLRATEFKKSTLAKLFVKLATG